MVSLEPGCPRAEVKPLVKAALERAREGTETSNEVPSVGDLRYGSSSSRMKTALAAGTLFGLVSLVALI